jgi:transposase InsO family protein
VSHTCATLAASQRRACKVIDQPRSTQRYESKRPNDEEQHLVKHMHELVREHPRYGCRRIWAMLRLEGFSRGKVNRKRVHRLWKQEHLKVPQKQHKKRHLGSSANSIVRRKSEYKDDVWCWDFIFDSDARGRTLKWLCIVDEYTRECLALEVERSMTARDVIDVLEELFLIRGLPMHIRSDNGPEFIADAIKSYLERAKVGTLYIEKGSPWENGYAESFNGKLRDELLNAEVFEGVRDAKAHAARWRNDYNHRRPHSSLGYVPPARFAATCAGAAPLRLAALASAARPPHTSKETNQTLITTGT